MNSVQVAVVFQLLFCPCLFGQSVVLDTSFGQGDGIVDYGVAGAGSDAVLFSDGSIAVVTWPSSEIVKLDADGSLDPAFGDSGKVEIDLPGINDTFVAIALNTDEEVLVLGRSRVGNFKQAHLLRLLADGSVDVSFGNNGMFTYAEPAHEVTAYDLDVGMGGRIFVAGSYSTQITATSGNWFIAALSPGGLWDSSFGQAGLVQINVGGFAYCERVAELSDGSIILGGSGAQFILAKTLYDGSLDLSFGNSGLVLVDEQEGQYISDAMYDLLVMPDGKILCAGDGLDFPLTWGYGMFAKLMANGSLDSTFCGNGLSALTSSGFLAGSLTSIQPDPQGRILGLLGYPGAGFSMLARFTPNGEIDLGFGTDGYYEAGDEYRTMLIQPDGKVLLIGTYASSGRICRLILPTWTSLPETTMTGTSINVTIHNEIAQIQVSSTLGAIPINWSVHDVTGRYLSSGHSHEVRLPISPEMFILRVQAGQAMSAFKLMTGP